MQLHPGALLRGAWAVSTVAGCATPALLTVSGTARGLERIALSPDGVCETVVEGVAQAYPPARVVGSARIVTARPPVAFAIPVDAAALTPPGRHVVRGTVSVGDPSFFPNDAAVPLPGARAVRRVERLLRRVGATY